MTEITYEVSKKGQWRSSKIVLPKFIVSYPSVLEPKTKDDGTKKYEMQMIFDKATTNLDELKKAIAGVAVKKWGDKAKAVMQRSYPIKDGDAKFELDEEKYAILKGKWFVNCGTYFDEKRPHDGPKVFKAAKNADGTRDQITSAADFYAGCIAIATVNVFSYQNTVNQGVSVGLHNILKMADGTPLSSRGKAEDDFSGIEAPIEQETDPLSEGMFDLDLGV